MWCYRGVATTFRRLSTNTRCCSTTGRPPDAEPVVVTPWTVRGVVDHDKLVRDYGCERVDTTLIDRVARVTGRKPHRLLRRGIFYAHRDLNILLDRYEAGEPFYLYTGRGPSSGSMHLGHLLPFEFTQWLQEVFQVPVVIQLTDDEKYLFGNYTEKEIAEYTMSNALEIASVGFDPSRTFIFNNLSYMGHLYPTVVRVQNLVTANQTRAIFGLQGSDSIGKWSFPAIQAAPAFPTSFSKLFQNRTDLMCLIPQAIDQDPYFRMTRDVAPRLGYRKPALIHSRFFPALQGPGSKMSASESSGAVFLLDEGKVLKKKVQGAYSGGGATLQEHREKGADLEVDVAYQWLKYLMEDDDELDRIGRAYSAGDMLTSEVKKTLVTELTTLLQTYRERRAAVTDDVLKTLMTVRPLAMPDASRVAP